MQLPMVLGPAPRLTFCSDSPSAPIGHKLRDSHMGRVFKRGHWDLCLVGYEPNLADWIPAKQVGYFDALRDLAETAVHKNGGLPAVLVAHSMGSLVSLYFIKRQGPEWTKKHLASLIAMSAPWEGAVTALKGGLPRMTITLIMNDTFLCRIVASDGSKADCSTWLSA